MRVAEELPPVPIAMEVRLRNDLLWSGVLRVSERNGARFSQSLSDAPDRPCDNDEVIRFADRMQSSLNISATRMRTRSSDDGADRDQNFVIRVESVSAVRDSCAPASRSVGLSETISLQPGASRTLSSDGGLVVTVRRIR